MTKTKPLVPALALLLTVAAGSAAAHTGHETAGAVAGLAHPLALDHVLAMVAVGLWSAAALPPSQRLRGPAAFVLAMLAGASLGTTLGAQLRAPGIVEAGIAASVLVFGALVAAPRLLPRGVGLALVAAAGALHGLAHGAELPAGGGFAGYAGGFVATTVLLHAAGLGLGRQLLALPARLSRGAQALLGGGLGAAGLALIAQL
ncbi:MAG: HupE/UreJ family protein [Proteobacteria bacterium]|nr:HupE/UreJ family protein [Pseudomonadota bacterium]